MSKKLKTVFPRSLKNALLATGLCQWEMLTVEPRQLLINWFLHYSFKGMQVSLGALLANCSFCFEVSYRKWIPAGFGPWKHCSLAKLSAVICCDMHALLNGYVMSSWMQFQGIFTITWMGNSLISKHSIMLFLCKLKSFWITDKRMSCCIYRTMPTPGFHVNCY